MIFYTKTAKKQYFTAAIWVCAVAAASYPFSEIIGYRSVALFLLLTVSVLAMRLNLYPVLLAALLSALIWDFFFIPPTFTFHVNDYSDVLMLGMYFVIALLNGVLTARIRFFEQLARRKELRANTLKLYDTLFNSLSHELRTPIATILGASDNLMAADILLNENDKKNLYREINTASERLHRLTDNLLNMSRLESGIIQPKLDWCDVSELVYTVKNHLEESLRNRKVNISIAENLPLFKLDFGLMEEVLHNLLYNAAMHTPENAAINIGAGYSKDQLIISVSDTGKGLSKEDLKQVFEKFYRSKTARAGGIGLGLSVAKGFVEAHGGNIRAENQPGGGALFIIQIPTQTRTTDDIGDE